MLVHQVALGDIHTTHKRDTGLMAPPGGSHSVCGISKRENPSSEFTDNEYVIYDTAQQKMSYLVEFTVEGDPEVKVTERVKITTAEDTILDDNHCQAVEISDVKNVENPLSKVKAGLQSDSEAPVPLKSVHIRAKLLDLAAQVCRT